MGGGILLLHVLILLFSFHGCEQDTHGYPQLQKTRDRECPTWFVNQTGNCKCGVGTLSSLVIVKCDDYSYQTMLLSGYCMTHTDVTVAGSCPYNSHKTDYKELYVKLPRNVCRINEFMCGGLNRTGPYCSHCQEGLGIPVFSYTFGCLPCLGSLIGWLLYIFLAVFPTTIFFLIVIIFQVRVTSAPMNAFILVCQFLSNGENSVPYEFYGRSTFMYYLILVLTTVFGAWNLDFFRYVLPPFCISNQLTPIQVLALEYIVAFYPLLLIITTYICVELHARDCRLIVWLWRPFSRCFRFVLRGRKVNFSFVHAFSSFLLLSYSKILFVSFQLLSATNFNNPFGQRVGPTVLFYDASIEYFGTKHIPFALLAIFVLCVFVILPALFLLLYPTRAFQRSLGCCRVRWHALHAFADTFNGYYKNGTEGTRDYRYFAGLYLVLRIVLQSLILGFFSQYYWLLVVTCCGVASTVLAILHPYKDNNINVWDSVIFALLTFSLLWVTYARYIASLPFEVTGAIGTIPFIYITLYMMYKHTNAFQKCYVFLNKCRANPPLQPDRPEEYSQLLHIGD